MVVQYFNVHMERVVDGRLRIVAAGEIDLATGDVLFQVATDVISTTRHEGIEVVDVNLAGVTLLDAAAVGVLLAVQNHARDRGIQVRIEGATGLPLQVLEITGTLAQLGGKSATTGRAPAPRDPR
jgi:anti-anti-sigma factor